MFLLGTATTFAGAVLAACGSEKAGGVAISDVPVGSAVLVDNFIIAQPSAGVYKAYSNVCPHQGADINKIEGGQAICPKHNSVFSLEDGSVVSGPARGAMAPAKLTKEGDQLQVARA
ncbi:3-phenylpropionate dioxygenase ferredoxin subunit [Corynebacterium kalinowskii]|uniref:3-phenylpropionate dioxygenase ferredoxin subunit n=2 Tax=Corynebacterium kalinowskii TaxID=2675216 RepID=A0A6B8VX53_9CORY|nr:3-phenylpropionate dioxygenase ferredoxin subunit [Corynebacterium kalinowskii]